MKIEHIGDATLYLGDCLESLKTMPDKSIQMCVTSPPYYGLRDYGVEGQIGLEETPDEYITKLVEIFHEVKRVLKDDGTLWVNIGDSYAGSGKGQTKNGASDRKVNKTKGMNLNVQKPSEIGLKPKDLIGIPWMLAFALRSDGWYLRQDIIWAKPSPLPESVKDRCTKSHEYIFLLSKSARYYYNSDAICEPTKTKDNIIRQRDITKLNNTPGRLPMRGLKTNNYNFRNRRDVWTIVTKPYHGAHFAVFPPEIPRLCILAGSRQGDTILDPFAGSGTTGAVAISLYRKAVLCELNTEYAELIKERITNEEAFYQPDLITSNEGA